MYTLVNKHQKHTLTKNEFENENKKMKLKISKKKMLKGLKITWIRGAILLPSYFIFLDSFRRHFDSLFRSNLVGPFLGNRFI